MTTMFDIRQIDAWNSPEGWIYNTSWRLGTFTTAAKDEPRAFRRALARLGIKFMRGATVTVDDGSVIEIVDRQTGEPLFAAIPEEG